MCPLRGGGESCGPNRQHIVIAEACPFNTGEALINLRREPEISTSGTGWERLTLIPTLVCFSFGGGISAKAAHGEERNWLTRLNASYARLLIWAIDDRVVTAGSAVILLAIGLGSLFFIGTEFMRLTPLFAAIRRGAVLLLRAESV
jgi:hypothetical protein